MLRTALLVLLLSLVAAKRPNWKDLTPSYTFEQYVSDFGKHYKTNDEFSRRAGIYRENLNLILSHNSDVSQSSSWKMGVTQFTDWSMEERVAHGGFKRVDSKEADAQPLRTHKVPSFAFEAPNSLDYRLHQPPVLTGIKNQGHCADCWAHAATECIESHFAIQTGQLHVLSQQQVTSCTNMSVCSSAGQGGCFGGSPHVAVQQVAKFGGLHSNWQYPFTDWYTGANVTSRCRLPQDETQMETPVVTTTGYVQVPTNDEQATLHALVTKGPLSIGVAACPWYDYEGGIFTLPTNASQNRCFNLRYRVTHVTQLVGYGYDFGLEKHYWIVRNSWGAAWGEDGYIRLERFPSSSSASHSPEKSNSAPTGNGEPCGWDKFQFINCNVNRTTAQRVCGTSALLSEVMYPEVKPV